MRDREDRLANSDVSSLLLLSRRYGNAEFDAYLTVDWSASSRSVTGGESIW